MGEKKQLSVPDLIAEQEVPEQSTVRVSEVEGFLHHNIGIVTEILMEGVVLQFGCVQMGSSVLINSELPNDPLEVVHGEEIGTVPARSDESSSSTCVR